MSPSVGESAESIEPGQISVDRLNSGSQTGATTPIEGGGLAISKQPQTTASLLQSTQDGGPATQHPAPVWIRRSQRKRSVCTNRSTRSKLLWRAWIRRILPSPQQLSQLKKEAAAQTNWQQKTGQLQRCSSPGSETVARCRTRTGPGCGGGRGRRTETATRGGTASPRGGAITLRRNGAHSRVLHSTERRWGFKIFSPP